MKSVIAAGVVFILTISICVTCFYVATSFSKDLAENITEVKKALKENDLTRAKLYTDKSIKRLKKSEKLLSAITNHLEISSIRNGLSRLNQQLKDENIKEASVSALDITELLNKLYDSERLTLENVF